MDRLDTSVSALKDCILRTIGESAGLLRIHVLQYHVIGVLTRIEANTRQFDVTC